MKVFGPVPGAINLQKPGNVFMENVIYFHDILLTVMFFILMLVTWFLIITIVYFGLTREYYKYYYKIYEYILQFLVYLESIVVLMYKKGADFHPLYALVFYFMAYRITREDDYIHPKINHVPGKIFDFNAIIDYEPYEDFKNKRGINYKYYFYSDITLEFLWTVFPTLILFGLAIPSFGLLYSIEKFSAPELTIKVIGHQWYWEYHYMDYIDVKKIVSNNTAKVLFTSKPDDNYIIESYMIQDEDLAKGQYRLLEVDKKLILPSKTPIRLYITSDDVLHSWAVPSLGIKLDACPGRINELNIKIKEIGIFYGQCSELCGWYHGFMPIAIQTLEPKDFKNWAISSFLDIKYLNVKK